MNVFSGTYQARVWIVGGFARSGLRFLLHGQSGVSVYLEMSRFVETRVAEVR